MGSVNFNIARLSLHVRSFLLGIDLMPPRRVRVVVALSGGRDSMLLLKVAAFFRSRGWIGSLGAVWVDYGTWGGRRLERLVADGCRREGAALEVVRRRIDIGGPNFEAKARDVRLGVFADLADRRAWIWQAHHLDDSFEWSLMQRMKSCSPGACLGIPLRRGRILRPFLCLSRDQITHFCRALGVAYLDDPSNADDRFERVRLRRVIASLKAMYPKLLKHYAVQQNEEARLYRPHAKESAPAGVALHRLFGSLVLVDGSGSRFAEASDHILRAVRSLKPGGRGSIGWEIQKIAPALAAGRRGPLSLSGGIEVHLGPPDRILLCPAGRRPFGTIGEAILSKMGKSRAMSLGEIAKRRPSAENVFTEYAFFDRWPEACEEFFVKEPVRGLGRLGGAIKGGRYGVARLGRLRSECAKSRHLASLVVGCLYY